MPQVKVRRQGITADETASAIRSSLAGERLEISQNGDRGLELKKSYLVRASVTIRSAPGGGGGRVEGTRGPARGTAPPGTVARPLQSAGATGAAAAGSADVITVRN